MFVHQIRVMVSKIKLKVLKAKVKSSCDRFNFDRGSSVTAVEALKQAGAEVLGVVAIFTYGLKKQMIHLAIFNYLLHFK